MIKGLCCVALAIFLFGCANQDDKEMDTNSTNKIKANKNTQTAYKVGEKIKLTSVSNGEITLIRTNNGFKIDGDEKKMVIFDIFGTYCQPCRDEAENLMNLQTKYSNNVVLIGLIYFENVTNQHVMDDFVKRYNAYYFISNSDENKKLVKTITDDIKYPIKDLGLPFKVILENGDYKILVPNGENSTENKYYMGRVSIDTIESNIQ